jgi:glutathione S-transferase
MSGHPEPTLRMERVFAGSPERVFDAWTSVETLRRWWPAGPGWDTPVAEVDARVGGGLRLVMRDLDGHEFGGEGVFVSVDRPALLSFTWRWDSTDLGAEEQAVDVTFVDNNDGTTTVVLTNTGLTAAEEQSHREGWDASFDNLDHVLRNTQS